MIGGMSSQALNISEDLLETSVRCQWHGVKEPYHPYVRLHSERGGGLNQSVSMVSVGDGVRSKKHISLFCRKDAWGMAKM